MIRVEVIEVGDQKQLKFESDYVEDESEAESDAEPVAVGGGEESGESSDS